MGLSFREDFHFLIFRKKTKLEFSGCTKQNENGKKLQPRSMYILMSRNVPEKKAVPKISRKKTKLEFSGCTKQNENGKKLQPRSMYILMTRNVPGKKAVPKISRKKSRLEFFGLVMRPRRGLDTAPAGPLPPKHAPHQPPRPSSALRDGRRTGTTPAPSIPQSFTLHMLPL